MMAGRQLLNYVSGRWEPSRAADALAVSNPATGEALASVPLSRSDDVDAVVRAAVKAHPQWRRTPPGERIQFLFKLKDLLERNLQDLARTITQECGKTLAESEGELRRAIENVEVATGVPSLMMGANVEDIAAGIDELMIRQPVGVVAVITPFNFPGMIPFWFIPYALACGNCVILKPSEKTPVTMARAFELVEQLGLPPGVLNMVHGGQAAVEALVDHPSVR